MHKIKKIQILCLTALYLSFQAIATAAFDIENLQLDRVQVLEQNILAEFSNISIDGADYSQGETSVLKPSTDSRLIYVSSSSGNDKTGKVYSSMEISDYKLPGQVLAFRSIHAALKNVRRDYPDYLLLKRGDSWNIDKPIVLTGGRSPTERMVIMAYGGNSERPRIKSFDDAIKLHGTASSTAIISLHLYAINRDPHSQVFAGWGSVPQANGIKAFAKKGNTAMSILIEDCVIDFYSKGISLTGGGRFNDIIVRGNIIKNSYNEKSHSQGFYAQNASILLEYNLFDRNGWNRQNDSLISGKSYGQATKFNHHTYFANSRNSIIRNNVFLRSASASNKWSSNSKDAKDTINAENILVKGNFYYGGEIGISAGGNKDRNTGPRWRNMAFINNVFLGIGKQQPTNRKLGWYITIDDWDTGFVCGNLLLDNQNPEVTRLSGISIRGHSSNIVISHNTISGLITQEPGAGAISMASGPINNITIANNSVQLQGSKMRVITMERNENINFRFNTYFSEAPSNKWFRLNGKNLGFNDWKLMVSDEDSRVGKPMMRQSIQGFEVYLNKIGISSIEDFVKKISDVSGHYESNEFSSTSINEYFRRQIENDKCPI